jgi:hypothetical protein
MKVLVTGSRDWSDRAAIERGFDAMTPTLVIHGDAKGADSIAHEVAMSRGIDVARFPANWNKHGKAAGPHRNRLMHELMKPDVVLAFPLPQSKGTLDMMRWAEAKGTPVLVSGVDF